MKQNLKDLTSLSSGAAILLEALVAYAKAHSAADVMYYICRVFGVALPLHIAIPLRIALIVFFIVLVSHYITKTTI